MRDAAILTALFFFFCTVGWASIVLFLIKSKAKK